VINVADIKMAVGRLRLEVAPQTECLVAHHQEFIVHRSVRVVAGHAAFAQRHVLKYERSALFGMTLEAGVIFAHHVGRAAPLDHRTLVRIVAIGAMNLALKHRMVVRQVEFGPNLQVALETGFR